MRKYISKLSDKELLEKYLKSGKSDYFGELYNRYIPLLYGVCLKYLQQEAAAQDAVMQIFEDLLPKIQRYEIVEFRTWVYSVARNYCLQLLRKEQKEINIDFSIPVMESDTVLHLLDEEETDEERTYALNHCMEKLPEKQRISITLFFIEEMSYADITEKTGYETSKVKSYIQNGKRNLSICIEKTIEMSLLDYIKGKRRGKDAHRLEKEAMQDPFLADALEGFDKVEGEHFKTIESLQRQIASRTVQRRKIIWNWGIAASLLIGVLTGGYFFLKSDYIEDPMLAMETAPVIEDSTSKDVLIENKDLLARAEEVTETLTPPSSLAPAVSAQDLTSIEETIVLEDSFEIIDEIGMIEEEQRYVATVEANKEKVDSIEEMLQGELKVEPVEDMLQGRLKDTPTSKKISQQRIRGTASSSAPSNIVQGKVIDNTGEPLVGAVVRVRETDKGTITDIDGNFKLEVDTNETLSVDYIGFESQKLAVNTQKNMVIAMNERQDLLSEVVVMSYGKQKKKNKVKTPKPVDGERAYKVYLKNNMRYPTDEECQDKKGKVKLSFYIDYSGRPYNITILESACDSIDQEAIRLVQEGPDWTTGDVEVILQIKF